jgi:hypothetical protein
VEGTTQSEVITYEDVVVRLVRYANITDFSVIDRMTIVQYSLIMEGVNLRRIDELENLHLLAFKNQLVKNTKEVGGEVVPEFKTFEDFFDRKLVETGISRKALDVSENEIDIYKMLAKT